MSLVTLRLSGMDRALSVQVLPVDAGKPEQAKAIGHFMELVASHLVGALCFKLERDFAAQFRLATVRALPIARPRFRWNQHDRAGHVALQVVDGFIGSLLYVTLGERPARYLDEEGYIVGRLDPEAVVVLRAVMVSRADSRPLERLAIEHAEIVSAEPVFAHLPRAARLLAREADPPAPAPRPDDAADPRERWEREQRLRLDLLGDRAGRRLGRDLAQTRTCFVARLNPVTREADLRTLFSRFGTVLDVHVRRQSEASGRATFAFVEFQRPEECDAAVRKMDGVVVDDRRIRVDYAQSERH